MSLKPTPVPARTVIVEVTVVPDPDNDSLFWEPSDTLVAWFVGERLFHESKDGWHVESVVVHEDDD